MAEAATTGRTDARRTWPGARLEAALDERLRSALATRAVQPIATIAQVVSDANIAFLVRAFDHLRNKPAAAEPRRKGALGALLGRKAEAPVNPFLPYDPALYVAHLPPRHVMLLNKYNVVASHALIVTEEFEDQSTPLSQADFAAAAAVLQATDGLVFFNGGPVAGASQTHKHLQLVPRGLVPGQTELPVDAEIAAALARAGGGTRPRSSRLPFRHALVGLDPAQMLPDAAPMLRGRYEDVLAAVGCNPWPAAGGRCENYNLLMTRRWMMAVPRVRAAHEGVEVNALGFAGALLVKTAEQAEKLRTLGPAAVLRAVTSLDAPQVPGKR